MRFNHWFSVNGWRAQLLDGALAAVGAALVILLLFLAYYLTGERYGARTALVVRASHLTLATGQGEHQGDGLTIRQLGADGSALAIITEINVLADRYAKLQWIIDGVQPPTDVRFTWSTRNAPTVMREVALPSDGSGMVKLDDQTFWKGSVFSMGVVVRGPLPQPITIRQLALRRPLTPGASALLNQLWAEWTAFEAWSQGSINFILGTTPRALLPPVPAAAGWVLLSALLYGALRYRRRQAWTPAPVFIVFIVAWLVLDARWQWNLSRQLDLTRSQFAGKSWEEQRLAGEDGPLFEFMQAVKQKLPSSPARIYLLSADPGEGTRYMRNRAHYHLLPHNVNSSFSQLPTNPQGGDYILILRPYSGVRYDDVAKTLSPVQGQASPIPVEPVMGTAAGALFRVRGTNDNA